jgi:hypothetical protein
VSGRAGDGSELYNGTMYLSASALSDATALRRPSMASGTTLSFESEKIA